MRPQPLRPLLVEDRSRQARRTLLLIRAHQRFALAGKDADIAADGNELEPGVENLATLVLTGAEESRRLPSLADALAGGDDRLPYLRPLPIADMAHRSGEIGGAHEQNTHPPARGGRPPSSAGAPRFAPDHGPTQPLPPARGGPCPRHCVA